MQRIACLGTQYRTGRILSDISPPHAIRRIWAAAVETEGTENLHPASINFQTSHGLVQAPKACIILVALPMKAE